jgi:hypothetical protein
LNSCAASPGTDGAGSDERRSLWPRGFRISHRSDPGLRDGQRRAWPAERFGYTYRHSETPEGAVVVETLSEGSTGDPAAIGAEMDRIAEEREGEPAFAQPNGGLDLQESARDQGLEGDRRRRLPGPQDG